MAVVRSALDESLTVLACPICGEAVAASGRALVCDNGHSFDIARQDYASLTVGGGPHYSGDTASMVAARSAFLARGHYAPIVDALDAAAAAVAAAAAAATSAADFPTDGVAPAGPSTALAATGYPVPTGRLSTGRRGVLVEIAGGPGYYSAGILDRRPGMLGITIDVSKAAARAASRAHPRLASVTADARAVLPLRSESVDVVLSVFGPRRGDEVARILAPAGCALVVTPRPGHLQELRERFSLLDIGADKDARLREAMLPLVPTGRTELDYVAQLSREDVVDAIMMGPNAFHSSARDIEALAAALPPTITTTIAVTVSTFRH